VNIIYYPDDVRPDHWVRQILAIGNFDGFHRGHAKLIKQVRQRASELNSMAAVLTFDPHPSRIVKPGKAQALLMTQAQKLECLEQEGIDCTGIVKFTATLSQLEPEDFVRKVLVDWFCVAEVWVGLNFLFGRDRSGNFSLLRSLGSRYGFSVKKIDSVRYKDFVVSSTRIRRLISEGFVDEAGALLGRHYFIDGEVVSGTQRGTVQGFPTANLLTENDIVPPNGVYVTTVRLDGVIHPAVTNIGIRPTFKTNGERVVETHIFNYKNDLYGKYIRVAFVKRLRDEKEFPDVNALQAQIVSDCERAKALFERISL